MKNVLKLILTGFFIIIPLFIFAQKKELRLLKKAYRLNSTKKIEEFKENWANEVHPISDSEFLLLNDTIKEAYKIYKHFGKSNIIQNTLRVSVGDILYATEKEKNDYFWEHMKKYQPEQYEKLSARRENGQKVPLSYSENWISYYPIIMRSYTITDFRPVVRIRPLYLNEKYANIFTTFRSKSTSYKKQRKRSLFLEKHIGGFRRHDGVYHITTPYIANIIISQDMKSAVVYYHGAYSKWEIRLKKENGWKQTLYTPIMIE